MIALLEKENVHYIVYFILVDLYIVAPDYDKTIDKAANITLTPRVQNRHCDPNLKHGRKLPPLLHRLEVQAHGCPNVRTTDQASSHIM